MGKLLTTSIDYIRQIAVAQWIICPCCCIHLLVASEMAETQKLKLLFLTLPWYPLRAAGVLLAEIDGVRILTNQTSEFIHRVTSKALCSSYGHLNISDMYLLVICTNVRKFLFVLWTHVAPSLAVLRIGSMEVGALLNDAYKEYEVSSSVTTPLNVVSLKLFLVYAVPRV